jgi:hypothetical protein
MTIQFYATISKTEFSNVIIKIRFYCCYKYVVYRVFHISRMIMCPAELKMQPTIHLQANVDTYFKYRIVLKRNYDP